MIQQSIIQKVSLVDTDYILIEGLTQKEIEIEKSKLIKKHIENATRGLAYSISAEVSDLCNTRLFFVRYSNYLVICGVYVVREKRDPIDEDISIRHEIFDYLLYNETDGFFFIRGCSGPQGKEDSTKCTSPSIYYKSAKSKQLLTYGKTYIAEEMHHSFVVWNSITYKSRAEREYDVRVFSNIHEALHCTGVTLFADLPASGGYFAYTTEKSHMGWHVPSKLVYVFSMEQTCLLCRGGYSFSFTSDTSLSSIMTNVDNELLRVSDAENFYFYICKNNTIAFDSIMQCATKFGSIKRLTNLFPEDASVNYQIMFKKETHSDVLSFVFGVITKSKVLYPVIMGCPIHDVVEVLCREGSENPYELPQHSIDEVSAQNIIEYIRNKYGTLSNGEIVHLLCKAYGSYSVATRNNKYWMYYHGESLRCEYLPTSMASVIGEPISGRYVHSLEKSTLEAKWKSELLLYQLVYAYYPDAIMHYSSPWLGRQHLDIFIPSLMIGIEYQGKQHYELNDFFGGEIGFDDRRFLDGQKKRLCQSNNVLLIEWAYSVPITAINFITILAEQGIVDIPVPNPFDIPQKAEESIPEEKIALLICQFSLEGTFLNAFQTYEEAASACGISKNSIHKAISGYNRTAGNYQWRRILETDTIENIPSVVANQNSNLSKPIYQVSLDGEIIAEFESIGRAEQATGVNRKSIRRVIAGVQKQAGGFYWIAKDSTI